MTGQAVLPVEGMEGENPEIDRLARECNELAEIEESAAQATEAKKALLKEAMVEAEISAIKVDGVTWRVSDKTTLTRSRASKRKAKDES